MDNPTTPIPTDSLNKLATAMQVIQDWEKGDVTDQHVRSVVSFTCCTVLRDMIGGNSWGKVLLDLNSKIAQHPSWR